MELAVWEEEAQVLAASVVCLSFTSSYSLEETSKLDGPATIPQPKRATSSKTAEGFRHARHLPAGSALPCSPLFRQPAFRLEPCVLPPEPGTGIPVARPRPCYP